MLFKSKPQSPSELAIEEFYNFYPSGFVTATDHRKCHAFKHGFLAGYSQTSAMDTAYSTFVYRNEDEETELKEVVCQGFWAARGLIKSRVKN